ncbi:MAG: gephyrin-like molybdotransferase Glp [Candidatus Altiarchaeota archaeon]
MITIEEARRILAENAREMVSVKVPVSESLMRVLAEDVYSPIDVPHFRKAAMDGFAVHSQDTEGACEEKPVELNVEGTVLAGEKANESLARGSCVEITTGAMMPNEADAVVMVEHTDMLEGTVRIKKEASTGEHVIDIGSDIKKKNKVLSKGLRLAPRHIAVLSTLGLDGITVYKKPCVSVIATGDELLKPGEKLVPGKIYGVNSSALANELSLLGVQVTDLGVVGDDNALIRDSILDAASSSDVVLVSGGSSVGREDHVPDVVGEIGEILFHGVSMKPGKPVLVGVVGGAMVVGVPGYPVSALCVFHSLLKSMILGMMGLAGEPHVLHANLSETFQNGKRHMILPVKLTPYSGGLLAEPVFKGSSAITSLSMADGFIEVLPQGSISAGESVNVHLF